MKSSEAAKIMAILRGAFPSATVTQQTVEIYERMIMDLTYEEAHLAVLEHVASHNYFPTIAEIRQKAAQRIIGAPSAGAAMERLHAGQKAKDIHPLVVRALSLCGGRWEMEKTTNATAWRSQFRKAYEELVNEAIHKRNVGGALGVDKQLEAPHGLRELKSA